MKGEPQNPEQLRALGFQLYSDGIWRKPKRSTEDRPEDRLKVVPVPAEHPAAAQLIPLAPEEKLNKTEREFLARLRAGVYGKMQWIGIFPITLKLAHDCRYTPDFATRMEAGDFRLWEVKGAHVWEDAIIKLKVAASMFPFWTFVKAQKKDGLWTETIISQ
jgi:hypothetical protein